MSLSTTTDPSSSSSSSNFTRGLLDHLVEGTPDSFLVRDFLSPAEACSIQQRLEAEDSPLGALRNRSRVLAQSGCFQGEVRHAGTPDEAWPWLRCPSIDGQRVQRWSPCLLPLREKIAREFGCDGLNIVKLLGYSGPQIPMKPHADKIVDLKEGVPIFDYRLGATRTLVLKRKPLDAQGAPLEASATRRDLIELQIPHNTLLVIGWRTNLEWKHGIRADPEGDVAAGASYALIFRESVTYKHAATGRLFGPRTPYARAADLPAQPMAADPEAIADAELVRLFGVENSRPVTLELYRDYCNSRLPINSP